MDQEELELCAEEAFVAYNGAYESQIVLWKDLSERERHGWRCVVVVVERRVKSNA